MRSRPPANAASGRPPPSTLPKHHRSGVTPSRPDAPDRLNRKPVITSSKISSAPALVHAARRPSRKPGAGGDQAHVRGDGFDDHRRDVIADLGHDVVGHDQRVAHGGRA